MFKFTPMRKLKAGLIAGAILSMLAGVGVSVSPEFEVLLKDGIAALIPLAIIISKLVEYYTRNKIDDVANMNLKD